MDNELMHLIEKVETLQAQNERYRVALERIIGIASVIEGQSGADLTIPKEIAQQALKETK